VRVKLPFMTIRNTSWRSLFGILPLFITVSATSRVVTTASIDVGLASPALAATRSAMAVSWRTASAGI